MRFGCCVTLDNAQAVQDAGYDYIELPVKTVRAESPDTEFEPVHDIVKDLEIVPEVWNRLLPDDMKITGPEVDLYRVERYLRTAFHRIEELGGEVVVLGSGPARMVPDGFDMDEACDQMEEFVALAGQIAVSRGITLAVEPLRTQETNIINTLRDGLKLIREVDHPFVKLTADLYHIQENSEDMADVVAAGVEIVHTHVADTGRSYPGVGSYPIREFFEALRSIGYNDRMSVECMWNEFDIEIRKALDFLRQIDLETPYW